MNVRTSPYSLLAASSLGLFLVCGCAGGTGAAAHPPSTVTVTATTSMTSAPVTVTATVTASQRITTAASAPPRTATSEATRFDFPADARASCMTADYNSRVRISDPGLRTQEGHKTTCGFAERVASVLRAAYHTHPAQQSYSLMVYSSILDENRPVLCQVSSQIATCRVDSGSEHIYVSTVDTSG